MAKNDEQVVEEFALDCQEGVSFRKLTRQDRVDGLPVP